MSNIDKQRIAAVRKLEAMGYVFHEHDWTGPAIPATFEADTMHALLVPRADAIEGCTQPPGGNRACVIGDTEGCTGSVLAGVAVGIFLGGWLREA
jgi:hypothetical protein